MKHINLRNPHFRSLTCCRRSLHYNIAHTIQQTLHHTIPDLKMIRLGGSAILAVVLAFSIALLASGNIGHVQARSFNQTTNTSAVDSGLTDHIFVVNQIQDSIDANPGDGVCDIDGTTVGEQCTLRAAVIESNLNPGLDTIQLPAESLVLTLPGNEEDNAQTGDLDILDDLNIIGHGLAQTSIDGGLLDRVFDIRTSDSHSTTVTMRGLTIQNGQASSDKPFNGKLSCTIIPDCGGAIRVAGHLIITDVATDNNGTFRGGGIAVLPNAVLEMNGGGVSENFGVEGGGIYSEGTVKLNGVTLSTNESTIGGGLFVDKSGTAILAQTIIEYNKASNGAGIAVIGTASKLTMSDSSLVGNEATQNGGGVFNQSETALQHIHFDFNRTTNFGGAIYSAKSVENPNQPTKLSVSDSMLEYNEAGSGGGIAVNDHSFTIQSSTLRANSATTKECGAILLTGSTNERDSSQIVNSTIAANSGGICHDALSVGLLHTTIANNNFGGIVVHTNQTSRLTVNNSIIANNSPVDCRNDGTTLPLQWENTLIGVPGNCFFTGSHILSGMDAKLGPLQDNGGLTPTIAPLPDSPAIDRLDSTVFCEPIDQIGEERPADGNQDGRAQCDLGAVEFKPVITSEYFIYLPLIVSPYDGAWRQLGGAGQRLSSIAFDIIPNQGVNLWVGDIRPLNEGGGLYAASLTSDCKRMEPFVRKEARFRVLDLLFSNETAIGATFGNKAIFLDRSNNSWLETPSDTNPNVYSLVQGENGAFYAGTDEGVYKSTNGTEWTYIGGPANINTLELKGTSLWIGTAGEGIQILDVATNKMIPVANVGLQRKALEIWDILIAESELYVATSDGVYRQKQDSSWEASGLQGFPVNTLETHDNKQFAGTRAEGAWIRLSGNSPWTPVQNGTDWNPKTTIQKLLYQKDLCGGKLFAGTDDGIWILDEN